MCPLLCPSGTLWAPNGASFGDVAGTDAAQIGALAPVTGTYLVLVRASIAGSTERARIA
jgi:hypothetical protein